MNVKAVVVMGVSGSGKSTFGSALAEQLGWDFADADDYHPPSNRDKMARGEALNDADRLPWLERLHQLLLQALLEQRPMVLACSALKTNYRSILLGDLKAIRLIFLHGDLELIASRMARRVHFMPVSLLESQFAILEPPTDALVLEVIKPVEELLQEALARL